MKNKTKAKTCGTRCLLLLLGVLLCTFSSCTSSTASEILTMAMPQVCAPMTESLPSETMSRLECGGLDHSRLLSGDARGSARDFTGRSSAACTDVSFGARRHIRPVWRIVCTCGRYGAATANVTGTGLHLFVCR